MKQKSKDLSNKDNVIDSLQSYTERNKFGEVNKARKKLN